MLGDAEIHTTPFARAAHTSDPLRLPGAPAGQSVAARRWRDLVRGYAVLLGSERVARPDVRARLSALVSLQLMLEGLEAQVARGEAIDHSALVQASQQLGKLLTELGLETAPKQSDKTPSPLDFARAFDKQKAAP